MTEREKPINLDELTEEQKKKLPWYLPEDDPIVKAYKDGLEMWENPFDPEELEEDV